jgi:hypothetical protein
MQTRDTFPQLNTKQPKGVKTMPCGSKKGGGKKR